MHPGFFPNTSSRIFPVRVLTLLFLVCPWGCAVTPGRAMIQ
jgi:hypothetical protein